MAHSTDTGACGLHGSVVLRCRTAYLALHRIVRYAIYAAAVAFWPFAVIGIGIAYFGWGQ